LNSEEVDEIEGDSVMAADAWILAKLSTGKRKARCGTGSGVRSFNSDICVDL
jgi:hypothetical protein